METNKKIATIGPFVSGADALHPASAHDPEAHFLDLDRAGLVAWFLLITLGILVVVNILLVDY